MPYGASWAWMSWATTAAGAGSRARLAVRQGDVDAVGVAGLGEEVTGLRFVGGERRRALLVLRDARRQELRRRLRTRRVEVVDDRVLVDGRADRLAQLLVVERRRCRR